MHVSSMTKLQVGFGEARLSFSFILYRDGFLRTWVEDIYTRGFSEQQFFPEHGLELYAFRVVYSLSPGWLHVRLLGTLVFVHRLLSFERG